MSLTPKPAIFNFLDREYNGSIFNFKDQKVRWKPRKQLTGAWLCTEVSRMMLEGFSRYSYACANRHVSVSDNRRFRPASHFLRQKRWVTRVLIGCWIITVRLFHLIADATRTSCLLQARKSLGHSPPTTSTSGHLQETTAVYAALVTPSGLILFYPLIASSWHGLSCDWV